MSPRATANACAFVILINNFEGTGVNANDALDAIAVRLASFTRTP